MPLWLSIGHLKKTSRYVYPPFLAVEQYLKGYPTVEDNQELLQQLELPVYQ